jgi:hypothetical protein
MSLWLKTRRTISAIAALTAWLGLFVFCDSMVRAAPLNEPISLNAAGSIDQDIRLWVPETYYLDLTFSRANTSFEELQEMIGSSFPKADGTPIQIAWSIKDRKGMPVAGDTTTAKGAGGWSDAFVYRSIAQVQVVPGTYRVHAQILEPVPRLAQLSPHLQLSLSFTGNSSWQMAILWWGMVANVFIGLPIVLGMVAYLLFIVVRHLTSLHYS